MLCYRFNDWISHHLLLLLLLLLLLPPPPPLNVVWVIRSQTGLSHLWSGHSGRMLTPGVNSVGFQFPAMKHSLSYGLVLRVSALSICQSYKWWITEDKWRKTVTDHRHTAADQNDRGHKKPPCQEIKAAAARVSYWALYVFFQLQLLSAEVSPLLLHSYEEQ